MVPASPFFSAGLATSIKSLMPLSLPAGISSSAVVGFRVLDVRPTGQGIGRSAVICPRYPGPQDLPSCRLVHVPIVAQAAPDAVHSRRLRDGRHNPDQRPLTPRVRAGTTAGGVEMCAQHGGAGKSPARLFRAAHWLSAGRVGANSGSWLTRPAFKRTSGHGYGEASRPDRRRTGPGGA